MVHEGCHARPQADHILVLAITVVIDMMLDQGA